MSTATAYLLFSLQVSYTPLLTPPAAVIIHSTPSLLICSAITLPLAASVKELAYWVSKVAFGLTSKSPFSNPSL